MVSESTSNTATTEYTPEQEGPGPGTRSTPSSDAGFAAGAAAVVSAGLGLTSLTGTGLGDMMRSRQEIVGQIEATVSGGAGDQVDALYGAPWHTAALVNGVIALLAVLVGGVLLAARSRRTGTASWIKALALGGAVLGALGLLVAGGMYLDLFAAQPQLPTAPALGGG
ncbi:hypothetical protein ACU61A_37555 [Pseudonocardia sichuanensis]